MFATVKRMPPSTAVCAIKHHGLPMFTTYIMSVSQSEALTGYPEAGLFQGIPFVSIDRFGGERSRRRRMLRVGWRGFSAESQARTRQTLLVHHGSFTRLNEQRFTLSAHIARFRQRDKSD
jgi:hypothetical protein